MKSAFGEDEEQAEAAFFRIQKTISGMVAEQEADDSLPPVSLTAETVADLAAEAEVPESVREQIGKAFAQTFGDVPPVANNVLDSRLVEENTQRMHTAALEQRVADLQHRLAEQSERLAGDEVPWEESAGIVLRVPEERAERVHTGVVEGQKCLLIPIEEGESASINGVDQTL